MRIRTYIVLLVSTGILIFWACKKTVTTIPASKVSNPFDTIKDHTQQPYVAVIDSSSFLGIHTYILSQKCARPGCHDGSFEPDYRTVVSAYNTLVFAPVIKNTPDKRFIYRVVPDSSSHSWLYYRVTTHDKVIGRMPLYADTLSAAEISRVKNWIDNGAKDINGLSPIYPSGGPSYYGFFAFDSDTSGNRLDTNRGSSIINPVLVPANHTIDLCFLIFDKNATGYASVIPPVAKVAFSTNPFDFSKATQYILSPSYKPVIRNTVFGGKAGSYTYYKWNNAGYKSGDIIYVRTYLATSTSSKVFESPDGSIPYLVTYSSLKIK